MGLTIHYTISAPADWREPTIHAKLEQARQFAKNLPVVSVSELAEFRGDKANFQKVRDSGMENEDEFFWAKIQAQRTIVNPWEPGSFGSQSPNHMMVFTVLPAEGCEDMNIGLCRYPRHVWKSSQSNDSRYLPAWSIIAYDKGKAYPLSRAALKAFTHRWHLRRLPKSKFTLQGRFGSCQKLLTMTDNGMGEASIRKGRYLSHRKGYGNSVAIVSIRDRMTFEILFRFMGSTKDAEKLLTTPEFKQDLERMVVGESHITPAATGIWSSFCKTQYANDPVLGGWKHFARAHISVLAILEKMQQLGFKIDVKDEGEFWETRDLAVLAKEIGEYDACVAALAGMMKDAAGAEGMAVEAPITERSDFEHLEMRGQEQLGDLLKQLEKVLPKKGTQR